MEDCIIIGAGAAGLFAAGAAVHAGKRVTVLEHMDAPGKKLLITGKGRCNVTNNCGPDEFLKNVRRNPRFLYSALNACPPAFVMELLEKGLGVPLKTERGRRVFPQSDRAQDVLDALLRWPQRSLRLPRRCAHRRQCRRPSRWAGPPAPLCAADQPLWRLLHPQQVKFQFSLSYDSSFFLSVKYKYFSIIKSTQARYSFHHSIIQPVR